MDTGYAGSDPTILTAVSTPASHGTPYLDNLISLVRQPLPSMGSNLPLPGLFEAASRITCEDMAGIFSRAAAHLYEKTTKHPELSFSSPSTCDLRTCQPQSSAVPAFDTMDTTASSTGNSFNFLNSSNYMIPSLVHPVIATLREQRVAQLYKPAETDCYSLVSPSSFSEFMLHAMEISEAATRRLMPATSLPSTTSPRDQNSLISENMYSKLSDVRLDVPGAPPNIPDSPNSPSKQDSSVMSGTEDSDVDRKIQSNNSTKRRHCGLRKTQQKKVVCVPFGESKQKGEAPPSDTWAWRKYGQKPIKGSPFPRGYYRCSSSKGCPARKQVERSRNDPTMVIVTYTADHNHHWPANRSSNPSKAAIDPSPSKEKSQSMEETSSYRKAENLFSSIINSPNAAEEQVVSSMDSLQEEESYFLQRDVDLCLSRTSTEGDDVFDNLGELPESSAIFSKGFVEGHFDEEKFEQPEF